MEDEQLIECVSKYEFLYNLNHPKYTDNIRKEIAWKEISRHVQKSAAVCKQRWQVLRDAYRRALNKRKGKSEQELKNTKKWKYEDEMSFVVPFFVERKPHDNSTDIAGDYEGFDNDNSSFCNTTGNTDSGMYDTAADVVETNYNEIVEDDDKHSTDLIKPPLRNQHKKFYAKSSLVKKAKFRTVQSPSAMLISKLLENQNKMESQRGYDELDRFFLNISETVKKFSPYSQALAKNKIFTIISEMELQQFAQMSSNVPPASPQSTSPRDDVAFVCIPKLEVE